MVSPSGLDLIKQWRDAELRGESTHLRLSSLSRSEISEWCRGSLLLPQPGFLSSPPPSNVTICLVWHMKSRSLRLTPKVLPCASGWDVKGCDYMLLSGVLSTRRSCWPRYASRRHKRTGGGGQSGDISGSPGTVICASSRSVRARWPAEWGCHDYALQLRWLEKNLTLVSLLD